MDDSMRFVTRGRDRERVDVGVDVDVIVDVGDRSEQEGFCEKREHVHEQVYVHDHESYDPIFPDHVSLTNAIGH